MDKVMSALVKVQEKLEEEDLAYLSWLMGDVRRVKQASEVYQKSLEIDYNTWKQQWEITHYKIQYPEPIYCTDYDDNETFEQTKAQFRESHSEVGKLVEKWLNDPKKKVFAKVGFFPPPYPCKPDTYNTFKGFKFDKYLPSVNGDYTHWKLYNELIASLCDYNEKCKEYFLKFIAHIIQCPGKKPGVTVVILGPEGLGKSKCVNQITRMIGDELTFTTDDPQSSLYGRFNDATRNKLLIEIDESKSYHNHKNMGKIKSLTTQSILDIETKGKARKKEINFLRLIYTTNETNPVKVTGTDRRFFTITPSLKHRQDFDFFGQIDDCTDDQVWYTFNKLKNMEGVRDFNFERNLPQTDVRKDLQVKSIPYKYLWLNKLLNQEDVEQPKLILNLTHKERKKSYDEFFDEMGVTDRMNNIQIGNFMYRDLGKNAGIENKRSNGNIYCIIDVVKCKKYLEDTGFRMKECLF